MIAATTGHRNLALQYEKWKELKSSLLSVLHRNNVTTAIGGMASGWDTFFADTCIAADIPFHAYVPYKGQGPTSSLYGIILNKSDKIICCADGYSQRVFLDRNDRMLEAANLLIAYWDPTVLKGGTFYTVNRARKMGIEIINLWT